jgi:2-keto-4-pentenoate hydratase/2-oxohepta-3-ene-1,7-dioic acid hydratase in catechol pathway
VYLARILEETLDGPQHRVLASCNPTQGWTDVRAHLQLDLERRGATRDGARRVAAAAAPGSLTACLESGSAFLDAAEAAAADTTGDVPSLNPARFVCPVDPPSYRDFMTFEEHFSFGYRWRQLPVPDVMYELPVAYLGAAHSFVGPDEPIMWPHYADQMDYELELGIVLRRDSSDVEPEEARTNILGLTILNDFSARDIQLREMAAGLGPSKGKHFASSAGPWVATLDELDPTTLTMTARVNDEVRCEATSGEMIWSIEELVAWASAAETVPAGSLLGSGTANGGSGVEYGTLLAPGDTVELTIESLGSLRNTVEAKRSGWMPSPKR